MKNIKINLHFLIIAVGVILIWRGIWGIADIFIFPNNQVLSFVVSFFLGVIILAAKHEKLNDLF